MMTTFVLIHFCELLLLIKFIACKIDVRLLNYSFIDSTILS